MKTVMEALSCSASEANFLVERVGATFFVTLTGPLPGPEFIEHLFKTMPSAVFLFLIGSDGSNPYPKLVADLRLPPDTDFKLDIEDGLLKGFRTRESEALSQEAPPPPQAAKKKAARSAKASARTGPVFISAASANAAVTDRLQQAFKKEGLPVVLDSPSPGIGTPLRRELQDAIRGSRTVVLVWSEAAARSRWVSFEILTAFHFDRFILPCVTDNTPLPAFLEHTLHVNLRGEGEEGISRLVRAAADAPAHRNPLPERVPAPSDERNLAVTQLARLQQDVFERLAAGDPAKAANAQRRIDREMADAERRWPSELQVLTLAAYHRKNGYLVKHWDAIQAGRPPNDPLLREAEGLFLEAVFVDPQDVSALNGLASVLILEQELEAAAFFNERAIELSKRAGIAYDAAERDRELITRMRGPGAAR
jgi:hypothetical protein